MSEYDASRLANLGRDSGRMFSALLRSEERLASEINNAIEEGIKPLKIAHDLFGRCPDRESQLNLLSVLMSLAQMDRIPESIIEPFEKGIRAKRI